MKARTKSGRSEKGESTTAFAESAALAWLEAIGWRIAHRADIALHTPAAERRDYGEVVLSQCLCDSLLLKLISGELRVIDADQLLETVQ